MFSRLFRRTNLKLVLGILGISNGGTGSTTAAGARAALQIEGRTTFSNANYTGLTTDKYIAQIGTLSASRTITLPAASEVAAGYELIIADESGSLTTTNSIVISRDGSDTISGATSITLTDPYFYIRLISDGTSKWTITKPNLKDYTATASGTGITIDPANGDVQRFTMTASTAFTLATAPATSVAKRIIVDIIQDSTGGYTPTFSNVTWDSGQTPTFDTTANSISTIEFVGTNSGWRGYVAVSSNTSLAAKSLYVYQTTPTLPTLLIEGKKTNIDENSFSQSFQYDLKTTDATQTTIYTFTVPTDRQLKVRAEIIARRTGGTSGTNGDGGTYELRGAVNNASDTVTQNLTSDSNLTGAFTGSVAVSISGANILFKVTGMANYNVSWAFYLEFKTLSS